MNYKSLYRKYRPLNFDQLIGQEEIKTALKNSIINNKFTHSYIFSGPRGTGKTSTAKIFARAINCNNVNNGNPCNQCDFCKSVIEGNCIDVFEIDAASNNGVDEIRELKNNVQILPSSAKYKVYIIDEVHMLSNSAFNALLKTIEEPPSHVIFILATTEYYKIPVTIVSRCQQYAFKIVKNEELAKNIKNILDLENYHYEEGALLLLANLANGSVRDSLSILEQVIAYAQDNINVTSINKIFGLVSLELKISLLMSIFKGDLKKGLEIVNKSYEFGADLDLLLQDILSITKEVIERKMIGEDYSFNIINNSIYNDNFATISTDVALKVINVVLSQYQVFKKIDNQKLYFELIIMQAIEVLKKGNTRDTTLEKISNKEEYNSAPETVEPKTTTNKPNKEVVEEHIKKPEVNLKLNQYQEIAAKQDVYNLKNIFINSNDIMNVLIKPNKEVRDNLQLTISSLCKNREDECFVPFLNAKITAACENAAICVAPTKVDANWIMHKLADKKIRDIIFQDFGTDCAIFAISEQEWNNVKQDYLRMKKTNSFPNKKEIIVKDFYSEIENSVCSINEKHKDSFDKGKNIFKNFEIVE